MAARKARPAASTTSVDDALTATRRPGISTSSSTSPTASLPGPTEYARNATTRAATPVACEIEWQTAYNPGGALEGAVRALDEGMVRRYRVD